MNNKLENSAILELYSSLVISDSPDLNFKGAFVEETNVNYE